ncbi:hypothetical protein GW891_02135 [bacterium]|nr:hypothetical protein [bacterium]
MDYIILFTSILAMTIAIYTFIKILRRKNDYKRTLNMTFLRITLPKKNSDLDEKKETTKDFKEMVGLMEQLYASLKAIHSNKLMKKIL